VFVVGKEGLFGFCSFVLCCFTAVLFSYNVDLKSQGLLFWHESKLPKLLATDVSCTSFSSDHLIFSQFRKLNCLVFVSKNWPSQFFFQTSLFSLQIFATAS